MGFSLRIDRLVFLQEWWSAQITQTTSAIIKYLSAIIGQVLHNLAHLKDHDILAYNQTKQPLSLTPRGLTLGRIIEKRFSSTSKRTRVWLHNRGSDSECYSFRSLI